MFAFVGWVENDQTKRFDLECMQYGYYTSDLLRRVYEKIWLIYCVVGTSLLWIIVLWKKKQLRWAYTSNKGKHVVLFMHTLKINSWKKYQFYTYLGLSVHYKDQTGSIGQPS